MMRPQFLILLPLLIYSAALSVIASDGNFENNYCGKNLSFAQNNCQHRCVSGTDRECVDMLGEEYKCFSVIGCSEKSQHRELTTNSTTQMRRTASVGVCASALSIAVSECDKNQVACLGDLDCAGGNSCYSNLQCENQLVELDRYVSFINVSYAMDTLLLKFSYSLHFHHSHDAIQNPNFDFF